MRRSRGSVEGSGPPSPLLFVKIKLTKFTKYNSQKIGIGLNLAIKIMQHPQISGKISR